MSIFFSLSQKPPPGFIFKTPTKRELLTGHIALFAEELDDAFALLPEFCERVQGLLITEKSSFSHNELSPQLWHLTISKEQLHFLQHYANCLLDIIEGGYPLHWP